MSVDQKHLAEARLGILSILHTIMSSVTLLWSVLHQADNSDKPAAASAASTSNINLGSTKVPQTAHLPCHAKIMHTLIQMIEFRHLQVCKLKHLCMQTTSKSICGIHGSLSSKVNFSVVCKGVLLMLRHTKAF